MWKKGAKWTNIYSRIKSESKGKAKEQTKKKPTVMKMGHGGQDKTQSWEWGNWNTAWCYSRLYDHAIHYFCQIKLSCLLCYVVLWSKIFLLRQQNVLLYLQYPEVLWSTCYAGSLTCQVCILQLCTDKRCFLPVFIFTIPLPAEFL